MNKSCSTCNLTFEKEVGFFYGAMYVSYGLTSGFFIIAYVLDALFFQVKVQYLIAFLVLSFVVLMPITYRLARLIWMNIFYAHDPNCKNRLMEETILAESQMTHQENPKESKKFD